MAGDLAGPSSRKSSSHGSATDLQQSDAASRSSSIVRARKLEAVQPESAAISKARKAYKAVSQGKTAKDSLAVLTDAAKQQPCGLLYMLLAKAHLLEALRTLELLECEKSAQDFDSAHSADSKPLDAQKAKAKVEHLKDRSVLQLSQGVAAAFDGAVLCNSLLCACFIVELANVCREGDLVPFGKIERLQEERKWADPLADVLSGQVDLWPFEKVTADVPAEQRTRLKCLQFDQLANKAANRLRAKYCSSWWSEQRGWLNTLLRDLRKSEMLPETVRERLKRVEAHIQDEQGKRMARLVKQMSKRDPSGDLEKKLAEQREKEEKEKEAAERAEPRGRELQLRRRALAKSKEEAEKQQAAAVEVKAFLKAKLQEATRGVPAEQAVGAQMAVLQRLTELSWDSVVAAAPTSSEREVELRRWVAQHGCCVSFVDTLRMLGAPGQRSVTRGDDSPGITAFDSAEGLLAHWRTCLPLENRETEPSPEAEASAANLLWQVHDNQSCAWPHALPQRLTPLPPEQCRRLAAGDAPAAATGQLLPPHNQPPSWSAVLKRMRDEEGQYGHMGLPVDMVLRKMHEDLERRRTADVMKMLRSMSGDEEPGSELLASFASPITYYNLRVFQGMADLEDDGKECKIYQQAGKAYRVWNSDGNPRLAVVQLRYMKYRGSLLLWLIKELRQRNYGLCSLLFSQIKLPNDKIRTNSEEMTELFKRRHHAVRDVDLLDLASNEEEATTYWAGGPDPIIFPGRDQVPEAAHGGAAAESGDGGVNGPGAAAEAGPAPATGDVPDTQANGSHGCPAQQLKRAQQRPSVDIADLEEDFDSEDEQLVRVFLDALGTAPDEDAERRSRADHELRQVYLSDILLCLQELHASNLLTSSAMLVVGQVLAQALPGRRVEDICLQDIEALGCDELRQLLVGLHTMLGLRCRLLRSCQQMESIAASMKPQMRVRDGKVSLTRTALEHELHEALEVAQQAQQGQHGSSSKAGAAAKQPSKAGSAPVQTLKVEAWLGDAGQAAFVDALYLAPAGTEPAKAGARENGALQSTAEEGVAARLKCAQRLLVEGALHAEARTAYLAACRRTFQACMQFRAFTSFFKAASNGRLDLVDCTFALLQDGIDAVSELQLLRTKTTAKTLRAKEHRVQQRIHKLQAELERWEQQLLSQDDSLSSSADWRERQLREAAVKRQRRILQGLKEEMDINNAGLDGSGQQLFQLSKGTGVEWSQVQNVCQNVAEALENGREVEALVVMGGSFAPGSRLVVALQAALLEHVTGALDAAHQHALSVDIAQIAARKAVMDAVWMSCRDLGTELRPAFRSVLTQQLSQAARQEQAARAKAIEDELMNDPAKAAPKGFAETKKAAKGKAKKKDKAAKAAEEDRLRRERETKEEEEREAEEDKRREEEAKAERLRKEQEDMQAQHAALMEMQADEARKAAAQQAQAEAEARQQAELQCRQAEQAERKAAQQAAADREERKQAERQSGQPGRVLGAGGSRQQLSAPLSQERDQRAAHSSKAGEQHPDKQPASRGPERQPLLQRVNGSSGSGPSEGSAPGSSAATSRRADRPANGYRGAVEAVSGHAEQPSARRGRGEVQTPQGAHYLRERILLGRIDMGDFVVPFPAQFASVQAYVKSLPEPQRAEWKMHSVLQRKQDFADLVDDCRAELSDEFIKFLAQRHHLPLPEYDPTLPSEVTESLRKPANIRRSDPKPPSDASSRGDSRASTREQDERPSTPSGQNSQHSAEGMHSPAFRNRRGRTAVTCEVCGRNPNGCRHTVCFTCGRSGHQRDRCPGRAAAGNAANDGRATELDLPGQQHSQSAAGDGCEYCGGNPSKCRHHRRVCWLCGRSGHQSIRCPAAGRADHVCEICHEDPSKCQHRDEVCWRCGRVGPLHREGCPAAPAAPRKADTDMPRQPQSQRFPAGRCELCGDVPSLCVHRDSVCWNCGRTGHESPACPDRPPEERVGRCEKCGGVPSTCQHKDSVCWKCGRSGHRSEFCPWLDASARQSEAAAPAPRQQARPADPPASRMYSDHMQLPPRAPAAPAGVPLVNAWAKPLLSTLAARGLPAPAQQGAQQEAQRAEHDQQAEQASSQPAQSVDEEYGPLEDEETLDGAAAEQLNGSQPDLSQGSSAVQPGAGADAERELSASAGTSPEPGIKSESANGGQAEAGFWRQPFDSPGPFAQLQPPFQPAEAAVLRPMGAEHAQHGRQIEEERASLHSPSWEQAHMQQVLPQPQHEELANGLLAERSSSLQSTASAAMSDSVASQRSTPAPAARRVPPGFKSTFPGTTEPAKPAQQPAPQRLPPGFLQHDAAQRALPPAFQPSAAGQLPPSSAPPLERMPASRAASGPPGFSALHSPTSIASTHAGSSFLPASYAVQQEAHPPQGRAAGVGQAQPLAYDMLGGSGFLQASSAQQPYTGMASRTSSSASATMTQPERPLSQPTQSDFAVLGLSEQPISPAFGQGAYAAPLLERQPSPYLQSTLAPAASAPAAPAEDDSDFDAVLSGLLSGTAAPPPPASTVSLLNAAVQAQTASSAAFADPLLDSYAAVGSHVGSQPHGGYAQGGYSQPAASTGAGGRSWAAAACPTSHMPAPAWAESAAQHDTARPAEPAYADAASARRQSSAQRTPFAPHQADPAVAGPVQGVWAQRLKQRAVEPEAASRPPPQRTGEAQPVPVLAGDEDLQVEAAIKASLAEVQQRQAQAYASAARPKPQAKQQSVAGPVAAPGLQNAAGEYNCFLNVIIQCLWHCSDFRDRLMHWEPQLVQADRVVAALVELFQAFAETEGERLRPNRLHMVHQVVAPTALREALSVLPGQNFRLGEMSDAAEVLGALYESIKGVLSSGRPLGAKLVDETFGLQVSESVHCGKCDKESQSNKYTQYFYNVAAASLRLQKAVAEAGESFGSMLREIEQNMQKSCDKDTGGCGDLLRVRHFLNNMPAIFTMQLIWESQQESSDDILLTLHALSESVDMGAIYQGLPPATHLFKLRSMVCFYGAHYHAFVFSKETRKWLMFDDATVAVVGLWPDVVRKCQLGKIQPSVLFFEKAH